MNSIKIFTFLLIITARFACNANEIVTHTPRNDGFGAQFQTIVYSVIWAELNHAEYVYQPFNQMEHNYQNDPDFIAKKESLINFQDHFETKSDARLLGVDYVINYFESNLNACSNTQALKKIKKIFRENKDRSIYFDNNRFNIVVHVRRHNAHDCRIAGTNTPEETYLTTIKKLRNLYKDKNPLFHIHSQGEKEAFKEFEGPDVILYLNTTVEDSFIPMVLADVLVTSASSFSYTAGILSEGIVYYMPFWHPALPGWISIPELLR